MNQREAASQIIGELNDRGFEAFAVGGCVRDLLLRREPKDYDVVTSARPEVVQEIFVDTTAVGKQFGVVIVDIEGQHIEVATYRSDGVYSDGRRPDEVTFTSRLTDDICRRDFTINGLVSDLSCPGSLGFITDPLGNGKFIKDLNDHVIRAIGLPDQRFEEDKLRMLRAIRFAVQLDFTIEKATFEAIKWMAPTITVVSRERVREELFKILMSPDPARGIFLLVQSGLMAALLPQIVESSGFGKVLQVLDRATAAPRTPAFMLALLILWTHDQKAVIESLRLSNQEIELIERVQQVSLFALGFGRSWSSAFSKRFMRKPYFNEILEACRLILTTAPSIDYRLYDALAQQAAAYQSEGLWPEKIVNGDELKAWGFEGPAIGKALDYIETLQLDGEPLSREPDGSPSKEIAVWKARAYGSKQGWFTHSLEGTNES